MHGFLDAGILRFLNSWEVGRFKCITKLSALERGFQPLAMVETTVRVWYKSVNLEVQICQLWSGKGPGLIRLVSKRLLS